MSKALPKPTKPSLMYMVGPNKNKDLIDKYNRFRSDPKKENVLISSVADFSKSVEDSPIPKNARDSVINDRGVSTDSFVDLLTNPIAARPSTFQQCVDFFYPNSGVASRAKGRAPFISTYVGAYSHPENPKEWGDRSKNNKMPLSLGEVSMMYGWFIIYRLLLCPVKFGTDANIPLVDPDKLFSPINTPARVLNQKAVRNVQAGLDSTVKNLSLMKTAVGIAGQAAQLYASGGMPDFTQMGVSEILESVRSNQEVLKLLTRGANALTDLVSEQMGWDKSTGALVTSYMLQGVMSPQKLSEITDPNVLDTLKRQITDELKNLHKLSLEDSRVLAYETDFAITGEGLSATQKNKLSPAGKRFVDELLAKKDSLFVGDFLTNNKPQTARSNDPLVTGLLIGGAVQGVNMYLDHKAAEAAKAKAKAESYYTSILYEIDPSFSESGFSFGFESFENDGYLKKHAWMSGRDMNTPLSENPKDFRARIKRYDSEDEMWRTYPTCALQNGGEMVTFWKTIYTLYRPVIAKYRVDFLRGANLVYLLENAAETKPKYPDIFPCKTFNIFYETTFKSTLAVMRNLPAFSPFTHMFGYAPTVLFNESSSAGFAELQALAKDLGGAKTPDMVVIGAPSARFLAPSASLFVENYVKTTKKSLDIGVTKLVEYDHVFDFPQNFAPGTSEYFSYVTSPNLAYKKLNKSNDYLSEWKTPSLQSSTEFRRKFMGNAFTVNSQRLLNDSFGGSLSVGFDVALNLPIFNAQWVAMMSVLFCYPEALDTLARSNIRWAVDLKQRVDAVKAANRQVAQSVQSSEKGPSRKIIQVQPSKDVSSALSVIQNLSLKSTDPKLPPSVFKPFVKVPVFQTPVAQKDTSIEKNQSETATQTTEPKTSKVGIYVIGALAVGGATYAALKLRKK